MIVGTKNTPTSVWQRTLPWPLVGILFLGFAARMLFIGRMGSDADIQTFVAWTISLVDHGLANFYGKTSLVDYPPGYFYILALIGHVWAPFRSGDTGYAFIRDLVKLPAILADLGIGAVLYAIAKRFANAKVALFTAALYVLNPAAIFISAYWGQVDSVAGFFVLLAAYLLLKSYDRPRPWIPLAWLSLACSLLIKPQAAIVIPVFIAFAFAEPQRRTQRLGLTGAGILLALIFSYALSLPFHPEANPISVFVWLLQCYSHGSSVYPVNSANAFNLWAIKGLFWQKDSLPLLRLPQYIWGTGLVVSASALIVWRFITDRTPSGLLEACALSLLAFFVLATRMHERYSFDGFLFVIACVPIARRYLWASIALTAVLFANLTYSLQYLAAVNGHMPGANPFNLWGVLTSFWAIVTVGTFFALGYQYLDNASENVASSVAPPTNSATPSFIEARWNASRTAFDPAEGLATMGRIDYLVMAGFGLVNFVLSYVNYWFPPEKYFDEVYYARAAEEYLRNMRIYENTQPPLSKLLITLSTILFGGLQHGDDGHGWRFFQVVFAAIVVMVLYIFAKRVTRSTVFAAMTALFLTVDGMHYVQSRIATPEGLYVVFSVTAIYALYRFWIASQASQRRTDAVPTIAFAAAAGLSLLGGALTITAWDIVWSHLRVPGTLDRAASIVVALYAATGLYLFARCVIFPRAFGRNEDEISFADGSYALIDGSRCLLATPDGGSIEAGNGKAKIRNGEHSANRSGALKYEVEDLAITYRGDPSVTYESNGSMTTYAHNELRSGDHVERGNSARTWLIVFAIAQGLFICTKWNGVTGIGFSFCILTAIWLQPRLGGRRPAQWGNPRAFRLDTALLSVLFICATVYAMSWAPDLLRQSPDPNEIHNFNDVVYRQYTMFEYHEHLNATHPYSSKAWEWPLDYVPVAYYYEDHRTNKNDPNGCCVQEITSMPNPISLWMGLLTVPLVGYLAWKRRRKAYALIVLAYLLQWVPWMLSPRIDFMYEFYVDIPLICLCNAIALQELWRWGAAGGRNSRTWSIIAVGTASTAIVASFIFFFPILSAHPISWDAWHNRMWFTTWIIGPG